MLADQFRYYLPVNSYADSVMWLKDKSTVQVTQLQFSWYKLSYMYIEN